MDQRIEAVAKQLFDAFWQHSNWKEDLPRWEDSDKQPWRAVAKTALSLTATADDKPIPDEPVGT